jgi:formate--tetrahydrofolate ligase
MMSDLEIAQRARMKPIAEIAAGLGIEEDELELYGKHKAKVVLSLMKRLAGRPNGKYIDVTAITPTPLGEGKTTTTIGLSMALNRVGSRTIAAIRQPSLGPVFGIKGGAAGGGYAQVVPMEDFNLHMTGDVHAISLAHNLLAAMIDNSITHANKLRIDPLSITWPRVVDVSDRALRKIVIGLGGRENGQPRETGFDIAVASEVMAILGLTTSLKDFRQRLGRIVIGLDQDGQAVTAEQLGTAGAMAVLLRDTIKPTLLQTVENTPVFVHAGPFANIAHGNSSIIADLMGLKMADCVVTESGFGADMGMEKFMNIKCRASGLVPDAVVMVCTVRALKMHSGRYRVVAGRPLDPGLAREDLKAVEDGCANLDKQIENARSFGVPVVVAINAFGTDTPAEVEVIRRRSIAAGAEGAHVSDVWAKGGAGGEELARAGPRRGREAQELRLHLRGRLADQAEDRGHRDPDLRRRRRGLPAPGQSTDRKVHRARLRQLAHLHGQDAPVDLPRRRAQGTAERISACRSARSAPRWERAFSIPCSARCDDAGAAVRAQYVEDRHRRRRQCRRALLR